MKKTISILLVICIMLTILPTAFASWVCMRCDDGGSLTSCPECNGYMCDQCGKCDSCGYDKPHNMTIKYGVAERYLVTVPEAARIDQDGLGNINVSISDALLASNATLKVYVTGDSYTNGYWHLTNCDNTANKLQYTISKNSTALSADDEVLSVAAGQAWNSTVTAALQLQLETNVSQAGTYRDTLTFVVDYQKAANLQLNEYGFYYEQPYKVDKDGVTLHFVFYEEGYVTGWVSGLSEEAGIQPWTMNNGKIETGGFSFAIQNDGMTLFDNTIADDPFTLNLHPVVHANDIDGTFTSQVIGIDVVCDQNNITMYQNGAYIDSLPKSLLTWDKGIIYLNDEPYGFYYPDATMFAMIQAIEDYGASGLLFIKQTPIAAGIYTYKSNASNTLNLSAELDAALLESQDNWDTQDAQELYASIMKLYGFDVVPMTWGDGMSEGVIDQMTLLLPLSDTFRDYFDSAAGAIVIVGVLQSDGSHFYMPLNMFSLMQTGLLTFSVAQFNANPTVAQEFETRYYRWNNTAEELQYAVYREDTPWSYTYFVEGMTWQQWYDTGYAKTALVSSAYVYNGYVWADNRGTQLYYQGVPVKASDVMISGAEYTSVQNSITFRYKQVNSNETHEETISAGMTWRDLVQAGFGMLVENKFNIKTVAETEYMFFADMQLYDTEGNPVRPDDAIRATTYQYQ